MSALPDVPPNLVHLEFVYSDVVCFAMEQVGIPIIRDVRLRNTGAEPLVGAELGIQLQAVSSAEQRFRIPTAPSNETRELARPDLRLEPGRLRKIGQRARARLRVRVYAPSGECLVEEARDIDVLAFNEWPGARAPIGLLASFVTPNHTNMVPLLTEVKAVLGATTGSKELDGYHARSKERVVQGIRAVFECVARLGLAYASLPPTFEVSGQKVRLVEAILAEQVANCLDSSLLLSALLEHIGLRPLLILLEGHALLAVWLVDDQFPEGIVEDAARLRTQLELGQILAVETMVMFGERSLPAAFETAVAKGREALTRESGFFAALDVHVLRDDDYPPLPFGALDGAGGALPSAREPIDLDTARQSLERSVRESGRAEPPQSARPVSRSARRFQNWKDGLLDLTFRNTLLNFRTNRRAALPLDVPDIAQFEDLLAADRRFEILPRATTASADRLPELVVGRQAPAAVKERRLKDLASSRLHCPLSPDELSSRAIFLERAAKSDLEEGDASTLFLAIGLLRWFESPESEEPKLSPLLLYPVSLRFDRKKRRTTLCRLEEDASTNQTLIEKMRGFRVDLTRLGSVALDESGIDVPAMLRVVRESIQQMPRWEVLEEAHLGHFKFSKFLMWKDLRDNEPQLLQSQVVQRIADPEQASPISSPQSVTADALDAPNAETNLPCVMSADSSQMLAMHAALCSTGLVLQGPPGTGKSQTITNLIAAILARGQSVLFVSEKMAALEVVHRRLREVGIDDFCLELHSHKTTRKQVVESFGRALDSALPSGNESRWTQSSTELSRLKQQLNQYVRALHAPTPLGRSVYQVMGRQTELTDHPELVLQVSDPLRLTAASFEQTRAAVAEFATRASSVSPCSENPWKWSTQIEWTSQLQEELARVVAQLPQMLAEVDAAATSLASKLDVAVPESTEAVRQLVRESQAIEIELGNLCRETQSGPVPCTAVDGATWPQLRSILHEYTHRRRVQTRVQAGLTARWKDGFYLEDLPALAAQFARWKDAFFALAWLILWSARWRLRRFAHARLPSNEQVLEDVEAARARPAEQEELRRVEQRLSIELTDIWTEAISPDQLDATVARGERARGAWQRLMSLPSGSSCDRDPSTWPSQLEQLTARRARLQQAVDRFSVTESRLIDLTRPASRAWPSATSPDHRRELGALALRLMPALSLFRDWCMYQREAARLVSLGLQTIVEAHSAGTLSPEQVPGSWERAVLTNWRRAAIDAQPALRDFSQLVHDGLVQKFADADSAQEILAREWIRDRLSARVPREEAARKGSELQLLRHEIQKKARHIAIRQLIQKLPELRPRLKPCFLMSPLSVAQYLPAANMFEFVIFDEASQIETHDAIGAIARGSRVIIVGDSKQLPPTRFFSKRADAGDESPHDEDVEDLDSILDEAKARGLPELTLGWHYRSHHDSLIEFSNKQYYGEGLQVFPAARSRVADLGIAWHPVPDGVFYSSASRNHTRSNPVEAQALVKHLVRSLQEHGATKRTFGVVTFSLAQKTLIEGLLDRERESHPEIEQHWESAEPLFVKNLENVQGDERDEILFSIAYAKNEKGTLNHQFGALGRSGGERRLNVAITRARRMLRVFSTVTHDQIDLARTRWQGAHDLRAFLRFAAERGGHSEPSSKALVFDSAFEGDIHRVLSDAGYVVRSKVGCGSYRVDLAVEHPHQAGVYALGIECDGPMYRAAQTCRDRDRLRGEVLRTLSWRTYRVWSMAWQFDREREVVKLLAEVKDACTSGPDEPRADSASSGERPSSARTTNPTSFGGLSALRSQRKSDSIAVSYRGGGQTGSQGSATAPPRDTSRAALGAFAQYELVQELRGGGMAECFRARDGENGQIVFVKRVRIGSAHEGALQRELAIYAKLQYAPCDNVLSIIGQARDREHVALITEFADGGDLHMHVHAQKALAPDEAVRVALAVVRGLVHLHERDIVHRDLKPANVLQSAGTWKIADFGIAKDHRRAMPGATFQQAGSYGYAPPEQWAGTTAQPSADVYAIGKLLAFMITGGTDRDAIPREHHELRAIAFECTAQAAMERPSSVALLESLERLA